MSVKVAFHESATAGTPAQHTVTIPKTAVHQQDGHDVVLIVQNGRAERRAISITSSSTDETVVNAGLSAGDKVILEWPTGLTDGVKIKEARP